MIKESLKLENGCIEITMDGDLLYSVILGTYTDKDSVILRKYLDDYFERINSPCIRIWDLTNISPSNYQLTSEGVYRTKSWSGAMKKKWPGSIVYYLCNNLTLFGICRMYQIQASDENLSVHIINGFNELPDGIKTRIAGFSIS